MDYTILKTDLSEGILTVTITREKAMNALNARFFEEMDYLLTNLPTEAKLLIITGAGKAFVAGADIAEMADKTPAEGEQFSLLGQSTFCKIENLNIPVIAAVNGYALGGGCELAMACDFRIASTSAVFGQPEVNLGIIPGYGGTQRMARLIGKANAMYLILTAEMITAQEALRMGLVQKVVEPNLLLETTRKIAANILSKGPKAVTLAKMAIRDGLNMPFPEGQKLEARQFGSLFKNEGEVGMKAFLAKQKPSW
ncbi:MAG: enoyl-CoA hydratase/isomerase family protein [Bacteroidales bacterium]|nr:enoyl-CoA hydratase/isomerase family protein [Bacteroidales bacterium]MBN2750116.1 enoyl-CoA hydratase/isomerase family protein [Bacteroidales bacterium]